MRSLVPGGRSWLIARVLTCNVFRNCVNSASAWEGLTCGFDMRLSVAALYRVAYDGAGA